MRAPELLVLAVLAALALALGWAARRQRQERFDTFRDAVCDQLPIVRDSRLGWGEYTIVFSTGQRRAFNVRGWDLRSGMGPLEQAGLAFRRNRPTIAKLGMKDKAAFEKTLDIEGRLIALMYYYLEGSRDACAVVPVLVKRGLFNLYMARRYTVYGGPAFTKSGTSVLK